MRRQLIEALTFPKLLVLRLIEQQDCPHDSLFDLTSERCHQCDLSEECNWVSCLNDFAAFDNRTNQMLNESLRYGIRLVESVHSELRHDETTCTCEPCTWVREAQRLTEEFDAHLEPVLPGHVH
jgi:hypothetical protein